MTAVDPTGAAAPRSRTHAGRPNRLLRNLSSKIAAIPLILTALGVFVGGSIWTIVYSFTDSGMLPNLEFVGLKWYERLWSDPTWVRAIGNLAQFGVLSLVLTMVLGFLLAALLDQKIRGEDVFRTIFLYPFALSFIVTGLIWQWILNPEFGVQMIVRSLGWESFSFDPLYNADVVLYGILIAGLWQGTGLVMCIMLAGIRGIDQEIWKAAKVDGIGTVKTYLRIVIPMMRPVFITALVIVASGIIKVFDLVIAQTSGGPGGASEMPAMYVYKYMFGGQNLGLGFAASTMMLVTVAIILIPWAYLEFGGKSVADTALAGPRGAKPKRIFTVQNILLYGILIIVAVYYLVPLYVMIVTSLKTMPEIRLGNIFSPPVEITFQPWVQAWSEHCTGLRCEGLRPGFWNSVIILVPSVVVSIAVASLNGYALINWKFRGSEVIFTILMIGAFIPYQVMLYPVVLILKNLGLFGSLAGLVVVHSIFGMPILTLLFRNYFASLPEELFKAARVDGAGFWGIYFRIMLPMSLPIFVVAIILQVTGIWNDFLFGVVFISKSESWPMTVQLNNIVNSVQGIKEYNVNMAATILTGLVPLAIYFASGKLFVRGIAAGAVKG